MATLWLFDLDGVFINIDHLHIQAHQAAYQEVFRITVPSKIIIPTSGMAGLDGPRIVLRKMGIHSDEKINNFIKFFLSPS